MTNKLTGEILDHW